MHDAIDAALGTHDDEQEGSEDDDEESKSFTSTAEPLHPDTSDGEAGNDDKKLIDGCQDAKLVAALRRKRTSIKFQQSTAFETTSSDSVAKGSGKSGGASSKVHPVDAGIAENASVASRSSVSVFHKAIESGKAYEEHSLVLLRRLLIVVSLVVVGLSLANMAISKAVITNGLENIQLTALEGDRQAQQQVGVLVLHTPNLLLVGLVPVSVPCSSASCCDLNARRRWVTGLSCCCSMQWAARRACPTTQPTV